MPRETITEKAARLAGTGRITLRLLSDEAIVAQVRGDSAKVYRTGWDPAGWFCSCEGSAFSHRACSHIRSVMLVVLEPIPTKGPGP
jgi:hypothetical protein